MNALSPSEGLEETVRLLFRIQVREDKIFTRLLKTLNRAGFKIIEFDEISRRIVGYTTISDLEDIQKILDEYAISYSFEVTVILKNKLINNRILDNIKTSCRESGLCKKLYEYKGMLSYIFYKRRWWLIQIIKNKGIIKIVLLKKKISSLEIISPYYYTFYSLRDFLSMKNDVLEDLKDIIKTINKNLV